MEFNSSCPLKAKESKRVHGFEEARAIKSKATRSTHPIMRATIGKSYDLVPLIISSMFKYDYSGSDTNLSSYEFYDIRAIFND